MPATKCSQRMIRLSHSVSTVSTAACLVYGAPQDDRRPSVIASPVPCRTVARMSEAISGYRSRISLRSCGLPPAEQRGLKRAGNRLFALAGANRVPDGDHALLLIGQRPQFLSRSGARLVVEPVAKARP